MKIIAFGGSNSSSSINKKFAIYTASLFTDAMVEILDLNDYPLPIFSLDLEDEVGIPENAKLFFDKLSSADLIILSLAEHNGSYTAVFKNMMDWISRINGKFFQGKKLLLLSTSPGSRGGQNVMDAALLRFPIHDAAIVANFSLPYFDQNFDEKTGIINPELKTVFEDIIAKVKRKN